MPEGLDPQGIVASLAEGVLTLVIPMPEARKPHRIAILGAEEQPVIEAPDEARPSTIASRPARRPEAARR